MKEKSLRNAHRIIGVPLILFIILQSATGALMSMNNLFGWNGGDGFAQAIHFQMGAAGNIYRVVLGLGILFMACTGLWIYLKIRERSRKTV